MLIGPFAYDVALVNITFGEKILSVDDCNKRGFNVQERRSQRSGLKFILLKVPFADRVVQQMVSVPLNSENLETFKIFIVTSYTRQKQGLRSTLCA